jgi:hypothetical protein
MKRFAPWVITVLVLLIPYLACVNYLDQYEVGIARDAYTGNVTLQDQPGFQVTAPWVNVSSVDTRPMRVCITSSTRAYNCKLVQFVPSEFKTFVMTQGFEYYWFANRLSFNSGYTEEYRGMKDLMRGYAFSAKPYPFVTILEEYTNPDL